MIGGNLLLFENDGIDTIFGIGPQPVLVSAMRGEMALISQAVPMLDRTVNFKHSRRVRGSTSRKIAWTTSSVNSITKIKKHLETDRCLEHQLECFQEQVVFFGSSDCDAEACR
jgi:hypothetical protein